MNRNRSPIRKHHDGLRSHKDRCSHAYFRIGVGIGIGIEKKLSKGRYDHDPQIDRSGADQAVDANFVVVAGDLRGSHRVCGLATGGPANDTALIMPLGLLTLNVDFFVAIL